MSDGQGFVIREGLVIRPGDSLLLRVDHPLTDAGADRIADFLHEKLPGLDQVCFLEGVADWAVYRPGEPREPES